MLQLKLKDIRMYENREEVMDRIEKYQKDHNTTGLPSAYEIGLRCIGRSYGVYGANGSLFEDVKTGELFGVCSRDYTIYL